MRYRLVQFENEKHLTVDEDLTQTPVAKCDDTFKKERIGSLYNGSELAMLNLFDGLMARLKYRT